MYDKKSDYALNKLASDAIVYKSVTGTYSIKREDFSSDAEFRQWKEMSDRDYQERERSQWEESRAISLFGNEEIPDSSPEEQLFKRLGDREKSEAQASAINRIRNLLTQRQYRRLWMYCVEGMTEEQIAAAEGIAHQNVSKSILGARKKVLKSFSIQGAKKAF